MPHRFDVLRNYSFRARWRVPDNRNRANSSSIKKSGELKIWGSHWGKNPFLRHYTICVTRSHNLLRAYITTTTTRIPSPSILPVTSLKQLVNSFLLSWTHRHTSLDGRWSIYIAEHTCLLPRLIWTMKQASLQNLHQYLLQ